MIPLQYDWIYQLYVAEILQQIKASNEGSF